MDVKWKKKEWFPGSTFNHISSYTILYYPILFTLFCPILFCPITSRHTTSQLVLSRIILPTYPNPHPIPARTPYLHIHIHSIVSHPVPSHSIPSQPIQAKPKQTPGNPLKRRNKEKEIGYIDQLDHPSHPSLSFARSLARYKEKLNQVQEKEKKKGTRNPMRRTDPSPSPRYFLFPRGRRERSLKWIQPPKSFLSKPTKQKKKKKPKQSITQGPNPTSSPSLYICKSVA